MAARSKENFVADLWRASRANKVQGIQKWRCMNFKAFQENLNLNEANVFGKYDFAKCSQIYG